MNTYNKYLWDINTNNFINTGIYGQSILNTIYIIHVVINNCVDVIHDMFEGICHYDIYHVILYYTQTAKLFS